MKTLNDTLAARGERYGTFASHALISQQLKRAVFDAVTRKGTALQPDQREALEMICHKIARIINGDPNYDDSWHDIAGYAQLVADRLNGKEK